MGYKKLKFTDEELEHANNIDLIDYARNKGLEPKKVGSNSYHIKAYSFAIKGKSTKVFVFEAPIEAISYLTILKTKGIHLFNHHAIALGGVSDIGLKQYLEDNSNISSIVLCLNNDYAGIEATENIKDKYKEKYSIEVQYPVNKDYNEDLIKGKIELNNEKEESFCHEL